MGFGIGTVGQRRVMSVWRRKALEAFPEMRTRIENPDDIFSIYALWSELLEVTKTAHREDDRATLGRIYEYAEWCSRQRSKDVWNSVGVSFYEHLLDEPWMRPLVLPWLSSQVVRDVVTLWEGRLSRAELAEVRALLKRS